MGDIGTGLASWIQRIGNWKTFCRWKKQTKDWKINLYFLGISLYADSNYILFRAAFQADKLGTRLGKILNDVLSSLDFTPEAMKC